MLTSNNDNVVDTIKLTSAEVLVTRIDGEPWVLFSRAMELLGLNAESQLRRVRRQPWAVVKYAMLHLDGDDRLRRTVVCDEATFVGHVFNIETNRVAADSRPALLAFQRETVRAIAAYWTSGVAVNPRARPPHEVELIEAAARGVFGTILGQLHTWHYNNQLASGARDGASGGPPTTDERRAARARRDRAAAKAYETAVKIGLPLGQLGLDTPPPAG